MAITVLITLTTAGIDSGPFNLYSDVDGYLSAFESGVSRGDLLAGYSSALVPNGTTSIRIMSSGNCTNYIDLSVVATTTTTTSDLTPPTTTTSTSFTTTSTTTAILYNLRIGDPICRVNNCNDNATCTVKYEVLVDNDPVGSYFEVSYTSGTASVSLSDTSPPTGVLDYTEPDGFGIVYFTLYLKDSGGGTLASLATNMNHQSWWFSLGVCP